MEDWEAVEVKVHLVQTETEQGMAHVLVEVIDEVGEGEAGRSKGLHV